MQGRKHPVLAYSFDSGEQIPRGIRFHYVPARARIQSLPHHLRRVVLSYEQYFQSRRLPEPRASI